MIATRLALKQPHAKPALMLRRRSRPASDTKRGGAAGMPAGRGASRNARSISSSPTAAPIAVMVIGQRHPEPAARPPSMAVASPSPTGQEVSMTPVRW